MTISKGLKLKIRNHILVIACNLLLFTAIPCISLSSSDPEVSMGLLMWMCWVIGPLPVTAFAVWWMEQGENFLVYFLYNFGSIMLATFITGVYDSISPVFMFTIPIIVLEAIIYIVYRLWLREKISYWFKNE
jgi:hypothetical protein